MFFILVSFLYGAIKLPEGCSKGITIIHYDDENFRNEIEQFIEPKVDLGNMKLQYNSFIAKGSFCPKITGKYRFKVEGKTSPLLQFQGKYLNNLSQVGTCFPRNHEFITNDYILEAYMCYPIEVMCRTGCSLYKFYLQVYVSFNDNSYELAQDFISCNYSSNIGIKKTHDNKRVYSGLQHYRQILLF